MVFVTITETLVVFASTDQNVRHDSLLKLPTHLHSILMVFPRIHWLVYKTILHGFKFEEPYIIIIIYRTHQYRSRVLLAMYMTQETQKCTIYSNYQYKKVKNI